MSTSVTKSTWLSIPIAKLTARTEKTLTNRPTFPYPVTVCARHALCVAAQTESLTIARLQSAIARDRATARENLIAMISGRRRITETCQNAIDNLPSLTEDSSREDIARDHAIRSGVSARLTGYDTAIILLHAVISGNTYYWKRIEPFLQSPGKDDVLARWEHYTGNPLVGGKEDATPLVLD